MGVVVVSYGHTRTILLFIVIKRKLHHMMISHINFSNIYGRNLYIRGCKKAVRVYVMLFMTITFCQDCRVILPKVYS